MLITGYGRRPGCRLGPVLGTESGPFRLPPGSVTEWTGTGRSDCDTLMVSHSTPMAHLVNDPGGESQSLGNRLLEE